MKKVLLLLLCLLTVSFTSFATTFNPDNWYWIGSSNTMTSYINKQTLTYDPSTDTATFYHRAHVTGEKYDYVSKMELNFTKRTIKEYPGYKYAFDSDNPQLSNAMPYTMEIVPDTFGYALYVKIAPMVDRDKKLEEYKKNQKEEEKKAKHKEDVQTRQTYTAGILGAVVGNLLGRNY